MGYVKFYLTTPTFKKIIVEPDMFIMFITIFIEKSIKILVINGNKLTYGGETKVIHKLL